jgi:hypothetical protein
MGYVSSLQGERVTRASASLIDGQIDDVLPPADCVISGIRPITRGPAGREDRCGVGLTS